MSRLVFPTVSFSGGTFLLAQPGVTVTHSEIPTILPTPDLWHFGEMGRDQLHVGAQDSQRDCRNRNTRAVTKSWGPNTKMHFNNSNLKLMKMPVSSQ